MIIEHEDLKQILSKFTTQRGGLLYRRFLDTNFRNYHNEAIWFFNAFDYVKANYLEQQNPKRPQETTAIYARARSMMTDYLIKQLSAVTYGLDVDFLIALSGEMQEQRNAEGLSIYLLPSVKYLHQLSSNAMLVFAEDDKKVLDHDHVHAVRKQLSLSKDGGLAVCKDFENNYLYTVGVLDKGTVFTFPRIEMKNRLEWELHIPSVEDGKSCRLRYIQGTIMMPLLDMSKDQERELCNKLQMMKCKTAKKSASTITQLLPAIGECEHGAIVIFLEKTLAAEEAQRLASNGRGLRLPKEQKLFYRRKPNTALIKRMASIDGAILADFDGNCHAYGVILDGQATTGSKDRGARYNSTKTYLDSLRDRCLHQSKTADSESVRIGVVRSEDGMLDIFP